MFRLISANERIQWQNTWRKNHYWDRCKYLHQWLKKALHAVTKDTRQPRIVPAVSHLDFSSVLRVLYNLKHEKKINGSLNHQLSCRNTLIHTAKTLYSPSPEKTQKAQNGSTHTQHTHTFSFGKRTHSLTYTNVYIHTHNNWVKNTVGLLALKLAMATHRKPWFGQQASCLALPWSIVT